MVVDNNDFPLIERLWANSRKVDRESSKEAGGGVVWRL